MELSIELFYVTFFYLNLILAGLSLYLNSHRLPFPLRIRLAALGLLRPEPEPRPAQPNRRNIRPPAQPNRRNNRPSQPQPSRTAQPQPSPAKPAEPARCPVKPKTRSVKLETHPTNLKPAPMLKLREPKPEEVKPDVGSLHEPEPEAQDIERESNRKLGWRNRVTSGFRKIRRCF